MDNSTIMILLATSISLSFLTFAFYNFKRRRALERELSLYRNKDPVKENEELKNKTIQEIEEFKKSERERLDEELRQKRLKNDEEITKNKQVIDNLLESYKKSKSEIIAAELEKERLEAHRKSGETAAELAQRLVLMFAEAQKQQKAIDELRRTQEQITEALSRNALENEQYSLNLTEIDVLEIKELQSVAYKYSRIRPIILKAIYEIYYAPEVKKLVNRVVGNERVSGIYRITCKIDGRTYIGKSVDIRERWITHFKRAAGIETETQNLLYPAMRQIGLEHFSFEIIERGVAEDMLTTREKYWQSFYDAKTHGFSVR